MSAVQYGHEAAVLKLLQLGADKSIKSKSGNTAADLAKTLKNLQVCDLWPQSFKTLSIMWGFAYKELLIIRHYPLKDKQKLYYIFHVERIVTDMQHLYEV